MVKFLFNISVLIKVVMDLFFESFFWGKNKKYDDGKWEWSLEKFCKEGLRKLWYSWWCKFGRYFRCRFNINLLL